MLLFDGEDFVFFHDQVLFAFDHDFSPGPFGKNDAVALFYLHGDNLAFVVSEAAANKNYFAGFGASLGSCVRNNNACRSLLFGFTYFDYDSVTHRGEVHDVLLLEIESSEFKFLLALNVVEC